MLQERDYVMRAIRQLTDLIARVLKLALHDPPKARAGLDAACLETLGLDFPTLSFVDARSAARLLGRADRVLFFARLVEAKAEIDLLEAANHRGRQGLLHALELAHEVVRLEAGNGEGAELVTRLRDRLDQLQPD